MADWPVHSRGHWPGVVEVLALLAILAAAFAIRWPFRHAVLIRDEGEYAYLGQQILRGAIPYLDVYNQKTPLTFYLMAAIQWLAGPEVTSLRITTTVYGLITTVVLYVLTRRLWGGPAAIVTALAFAVMSFDECGIIHSASTEAFMLLWIVLALCAWYWTPGRRSGLLALLAGVGAGLAYQTKQTGIALLIFLIVDAIWSPADDRPGFRWTSSFKNVGLTVIGFLAVGALVLGYFAAHGAAQQYLECAWTNNWQYVGERQRDMAAVARRLGKVLTSVADWDAGLWVWGALGLLGLAWQRPAHPARGLWILLLLTLLAALAAGQNYVHYFKPVTVPLAIGNGIAAVWLWRQITRPQRTLVVRALLATGLAGPWLWPGIHWGQTLLMNQRQREQAGTIAPFDLAPRVAQYVAEHTDRDERLLVVGSEPEIYFLARRTACTRLVFTYPLTGPYTYAPRLREEFVHDLEEARPRYVVMVQVPSSLTEWSAYLPPLLGPVGEILERSYEVDRTFTEPSGRTILFAVYRRKQDTTR